MGYTTEEELAQAIKDYLAVVSYENGVTFIERVDNEKSRQILETLLDEIPEKP